MMLIEHGSSSDAGPAVSCVLWTPRDVERWLVAAFVAMPGLSFYSARRGHVAAIQGDPDLNPATFDWIAYSAEVLGRESKERLALLTWARIEAQRRRGDHGGSVSEFCREYGWSRSTFDLRRVRALCLLSRARSKRDAQSF